METTDPELLRDNMLKAVHDRATDDSFDAHAELRDVLAPLGFVPEDCGGQVTFLKRDPLMPSATRLGGAAAVALVQQSVVAAKLWRMRGGLGQDITVDLGQAIRRLAPASELRRETLNGYPPDVPDRMLPACFRFYPTADGGHVIPPNIYPGLKSKMLAILDCADNPTALAKAIVHHTADVSGMVAAEGSLERPQLPPTQIINDYLVAWLGATGAMAALARRAVEGGSYRVHVNLTRVAMWACTLGFFDWHYVRATVGTGGHHDLIDPQLFTSLTPLGVYQGVTENVTLSRTPHHYLTVLSPRGRDQPVWLPRPKRVDLMALAKILRL